MCREDVCLIPSELLITAKRELLKLPLLKNSLKMGCHLLSPKFQIIFVIPERYFCHKVEVCYLREIDVKKMTYDLVNFK